MPRTKTDPAPEQTDEQKAAAAEAAAQAEAQLSDGTFGQAIVTARQLIAAKKSIQADLQNARDFLNQAAKMGVLNETQAAWLAENLPKRTRGQNGDAADSTES